MNRGSLQTEAAYFDAHLLGWLPDHSGKFALIKSDGLIAMFDSREDALRTGYERFKEQTFLVKRVLPVQEPVDCRHNFHVR